MATLSTPGIGSGLDVTSIVKQLVALERRPIEQLQAQASTIQTKLSSFGLLQSYATNVRDIADKLAKPDFWNATAATSSDGTAVLVSSTPTAAAGSYLVEVSQLAKNQNLASKAYTASSSIVGTGTLRIELGSWNEPPTIFTADAAKLPVDIVIGATENTLDGIRTKINAANAGVTASVITDASGAKLVLTSTTTGATSALRITATDADGIHSDALGLSALAFNPQVDAGQMTQTQAAKNALATINGLAVTSTGNKLENVISGVTLTLGKVTTAPAEVKVALDTGTIKKALTDFAKAFTDINSYINAQTKYDSTTKKAATLQGDRPTLTLQSNLRSVFLDNSSASLVFSRLSDVGLQIQADGSMKVNDTKLTAALANPTELAKVFSSTESADSGEHGFAVRIKALASQLIASDGAITTRTKGLRESVTRNTAQQQKLEQRVAMIEQRLTKQYGALDTTIARITSTNSALSQSLQALAAQNAAIAKG
ncbi:MAG TPA: flagellar filament capping protein FliD [Albitalea sp.]|jgi:flagellar hook-associated protein 2|nr:flagellar filament capping protein FliD [Albitalea sp.]